MLGSSDPLVIKVPSVFLSSLSCAFILRLDGLDATCSISSLFSSLRRDTNSFASLSYCFSCVFSSSKKVSLSVSNSALVGSLGPPFGGSPLLLRGIGDADG